MILSLEPIPSLILAQGGAPVAADPSFSWIVAVTFFGVLIVAPVLCLWGWSWWRRYTGETIAGDRDQSVCGACGYPVHGLSSFACPECGGDLRDVGIVVARRGERLAMRLWNALMWSAMWLGLGLGYMGILMAADADGYYGRNIMVGTIFAFVVGIVGLLFMFRPRPHRIGKPPPLPAGRGELSVASQPPTTVTRTLTIMFIDIEGYTTKAAGASRDGVIALIRKAREIVQPQTARRHGRIIKTMGDGLLVSFDSPTEAVLAGRDVQAEAARRGATAATDDQRVRLRIGITTGEVALEDDDVYGDPVNLAARIQQVASPGDVFFSESTWHSMTRSEVPHEEAGSFEIKGVDRPATLYRAVLS